MNTKFVQKRLLLTVTLAFISVGAIRVSPVQKVKVEKGPMFGTVSPDGQHVFVTTYLSSEIVVLSPGKDKPSNRFYSGYRPVGVGISPIGDKLFVTNDKGLVKAIDAKTFQILDDIKVGGLPRNLLVSPSGFEVYVLNYGRGKIGRVDFIDAASHRILEQVEIGVRPIAGAVSPLGDQLYVACAGSNQLYVLDTNTRKILKTINVGIGPNGVALSPDETKLYVTNSRSNDISVIDLIDLEETRRVATGAKPFSIAVNQAGYLFVLLSEDQVLNIYSPALEKVDSLPTGKQPVDVFLSPDQHTLYVTAQKENRLYVYQID